MKTNDSTNACPKCGAPVPPEAPQGLCPKCVLAGAALPTETGLPTATGEIPSLERVAAAFPQIEILELIGRGGMGFVFKARQPHLDRFVALKLLPDRLARDAQFAERFNREGRVLARLSHTNIVSVYDFGQTGGFYYLLMEYVDGVNLRQAMRAGRFSPAEALTIVPKICEALQYAHEQGILHRDIKPENILLDAKGRVKIADFGIAKLVGDAPQEVTLTGTGAALGTPHYMAPEQLEKPSEVDHRADIYSLGVVFYEMLTGELPIGRFAPPSAKTPVDSRVDDVVFRTLEKEREKRYQSAGEVKTEVETLSSAPPVMASEPDRAAPHGPHGTTVLGPQAPRWLRGVGILYAVFGGLGLIAMLNSLGSGRLAVGSFLLLGITGVALLTRRPAWRRVALGANVVGLLMPWFSVLNLSAGMQGGAFAFGWNPGASGGDTPGLAVLFALLENAAVASGLWVLLRRDVKAVFQGASRPATKPYPVSGKPPGSFSLRAVWAAGLVGFSVLPALMLAVLVAGQAGLGVWELLIVLVLAGLPGLAGTILGWMALSDLRASQGRLRGVPLALFAALTWPLLTLLGVVIGVPSIMIAPVSDGRGGFPWGPLVFWVVAAGTITFAVWAVYATARWASGQPATQRRGVLRWVFLVLLLCGLGFLLPNWIRRQPEPRDVPTPVVQRAAVDRRAAGTELIRAKFKVPKGQVATFMICRHEGDTHIPMPSLSGYVAAPDDEAAAGEVHLEPAVPVRSSDLSQLAWRFKIAMEEGGQVGAGIEKFGPLRLMPEMRLPLRLPPPTPPHPSYEMFLTHSNPDNPADVEHRLQPALGLIVVFQAREAGIPTPGLPSVGSGTNWVSVFKATAAAARPNPAVDAPWIRYTFAAVELREDAGALWLAVDYGEEVHGDCVPTFRWEANVPGLRNETRSTTFLVKENDSPPARRQRVEFKLPDFLDRAEAQRLRDDLAKMLVAQSVVARAGEDQPVFTLPLGNRGTLAAWVRVRPRASSP